VPCPPGTYLPSRLSITTAECITCPIGHYCPSNNLTNPLGCDEGTYCPDAQDTIENCEEGYYCELTAEKKKCPAGYYCPEASAFPTICPPGTYCPFSGDCGLDPYTDEELGLGPNNTSPCRCPQGYSEKEDSERRNLNDTCEACPPGSFNQYQITRADECRKCQPGVICYHNALTDDVNDPLNNGNTVLCPDGYYCPEGALEPIPCPAGMFWNNSDPFSNNTFDDVCQSCAIDTYSQSLKFGGI